MPGGDRTGPAGRGSSGQGGGGMAARRSRRGGRGAGQGRGQGRGQNFGPGGNCVCPSCGETIAHARGVPCTGTKCPKCGATMTRQG